MIFLEKKNWYLVLLLNVLTLGLFSLYLAKQMNLYDKDAWYSKWQYWVFGTMCLIFPLFIMLIVFIIQMNCKVADKLKVEGSIIYNTPYTWIVLFIVPIIGWIMFILLYLYVIVWQSIGIYNKGKK